jgi:hypothetical protein
MVVDERGVFKDDSFQAAVAALQDSNAAAATGQGGKGGSKGGKKQPKQVGTSAQLSTICMSALYHIHMHSPCVARRSVNVRLTM